MQVLSKAGKIIPVMLMGKVVQQQTYPMYEYGCAVTMSVGFALFMFGRATDENDSVADAKVTTASGLILLVGYMVFDRLVNPLRCVS
jgi:hypothetical protein